MMEDMYFYSLNLTTTFLCLKKNQLVFFSFCVKPQYLARNNNTTSTKALVWQTPLRICLMSWPKYSSSPILSFTLLTLHQHMLYGLWQCPFPLAPPRFLSMGVVFTGGRWVCGLSLARQWNALLTLFAILCCLLITLWWH